MQLSPRHYDVINRYCQGESIASIARSYGKDRHTIWQVVTHPDVQVEIQKRVAMLQARVVDFKLKAFDAAEDSLEKIQFLSQNATDPALQRLASLDTIKIAGLMPRKRILVQDDRNNGISDDVRDFIGDVIAEMKAAKDGGATIPTELADFKPLTGSNVSP